MSWKSKKRGGIRKREEVEKDLTTTSEIIYMLKIASNKSENVIGPRRHLLKKSG